VVVAGKLKMGLHRWVEMGLQLFNGGFAGLGYKFRSGLSSGIDLAGQIGEVKVWGGSQGKFENLG